MNISKKYELQQVVDKVNQFMLDVCFKSFAATTEFNEMSKERLCNYISDDKLRLTNGEIEMFRAAGKWIENNSSDAATDVADILKLIRFPLLPADLLLDDVYSMNC